MTEAAELFTLVPARLPLLVNVPHAGRRLSPGLAERLTPAGRLLTPAGRLLTPAGRLLTDTDWHVERLYAFAADLGVGLMAATHSRYVVDLNRDPDGKPLYPGADNTGLCPIDGFDGEPLYLEGAAPDAAEVARRADVYWRPYHARLAAELEAIRSRHGYAILLDGHSIISEAPRFFDGRLPDLNLGTNEGRSCDPGLAAAAYGVLSDAGGFTSIHNGRFKGGYITRHYGRPAERVHALQLEKAQSCYMDEQNLEHWDPERAAPLIAVLRRLVDRLLHWTPARTSGA